MTGWVEALIAEFQPASLPEAPLQSDEGLLRGCRGLFLRLEVRARSACWPRPGHARAWQAACTWLCQLLGGQKQCSRPRKFSTHTSCEKAASAWLARCAHGHTPVTPWLEVVTNAELLCVCVRVPLQVQSYVYRGLAKMAAVPRSASAAPPAAAARCAHAPAAAGVPRDHPRSLGTRRGLAGLAAVVHTAAARVPPCCSLD